MKCPNCGAELEHGLVARGKARKSKAPVADPKSKGQNKGKGKNPPKAAPKAPAAGNKGKGKAPPKGKVA